MQEEGVATGPLLFLLVEMAPAPFPLDSLPPLRLAALADRCGCHHWGFRPLLARLPEPT